MRQQIAMLVGLCALFFVACQPSSPQPVEESPVDAPAGKRVLYVDSYDAGYPPSIIMQNAAREVLEPAGVEMQVVYMDEKRKTSAVMQQEAARNVKAFIESWQPDLVIAADDAASKYLVMPYYRDADLPIVFIGVNWDASPYGYPYSNATGQVEVELVQELLAELARYARGSRQGLLSGDTLTDQRALKYYRDVLGIHFQQVALVRSFDGWKEAYLSLQDEVDVLLFRNNSGIEGWDDEEARRFVQERTRIPTGTVSTHLAPWVLISYSKVHLEFAEYGATIALEILAGTPPSEIPITTNKRAKVYLNMRLAKSLGIKFPMELIERATFVE